VAFVRVPDKVETVEHILFCKPLKGKWQWYEAMYRWQSSHDRLPGLASWVEKENNSVIFNYCIIHRQVLASKKLNLILHEILTEAVKVISFIKS
jgi:hypothetical protein